MTMSTVLPCDRLAELMPDLLDDSGLLSGEEADHVEIVRWLEERSATEIADAP